MSTERETLAILIVNRMADQFLRRMTVAEGAADLAGMIVAAGFTREPQWVSVNDSLPEENVPVLWCRVPVVEPYEVMSMCDDEFADDFRRDFTHWMPLPAAPAAPPTTKGSE